VQALRCVEQLKGFNYTINRLHYPMLDAMDALFIRVATALMGLMVA
jgi:hypothetical protein